MPYSSCLTANHCVCGKAQAEEGDRRYHIVITAQGTATHWQARVHYYWYKKVLFHLYFKQAAYLYVMSRTYNEAAAPEDCLLWPLAFIHSILTQKGCSALPCSALLCPVLLCLNLVTDTQNCLLP